MEEKKPRFKSLEFYPPLETEYDPTELINSAREAWHRMQKDIKFALSPCYWPWQDFPTFVKDVGLPHRPGQVLEFVNPSGRGRQHRYHKDLVYWASPKASTEWIRPEKVWGVKKYPDQVILGLSECGKYQYSRTQHWALDDLGYAMFIGLNPSTRDRDRETNRCAELAKRWGYGGACLTYLFAYRTTNLKELLRQEEPVGPENDTTLLRIASDAKVVIAAWGSWGNHLDRAAKVKPLIKNLHYLHLTTAGDPGRPVNVSSSSKPVTFNKPTTKRYK